MKITTRSFAKTLFSLINENKKVLIGLSGGMDSVVLLDLCEKIIPSGKLFAIHINHGLTKESDNHEKFVYKICIDKNIPLILKAEKRTIKRNESDEMWARRIRYNHYFQTLIEKNYDYVLTAHHANDNCETIIMNLDNGCSINGLKGIPSINGKVVRPLIGYKKIDIINYAQSNKINYVDDVSNNDLSIKRNYVRKKVLTKLQKIDKDIINKFSNISNKATQSVSKLNLIIKSFAQSIPKNSLGFFEIKDEELNFFTNYHKLVLIKEIIGETNLPWRSHKYNLLKDYISKSKTGSSLRLNKSWLLLRDRKKWILNQNKIRKTNTTIDDFGKYRLNNGSSLLLSKTDKPTFTKDKNIEVIDYEKVKNKNLKVRSWVYGDSFQPLGMHGKKKVSDFLIDNKIDCFEKQSQLVLTANDDIIWLCGQRISDKVKVTKNTSTMMELSYEKYVQL